MRKLTIKSIEKKRATPAQAKRFLKNNPNRNVREGFVDYLAGCMQRGEFDTTHQGIAFDVRGALVDGQHRLLAIIKSNVPQTLYISTYAQVIKDARDRPSIDQGIQRTNADVTGYDADTCALLKTLHAVVTNQDFSRTKISPEQTRQLEPLARPWIDQLVSTKTRNRTTAPTRLAVIAQMVQHEQHASEIARQYQHFANRHLADLWPSIISMENRIVRAAELKLTIRAPERLLLSYSAFDPTKRRRSKLQIRPEILPEIRAALRRITGDEYA